MEAIEGIGVLPNFVKVCLVKDEEELVLIIEPLNGVGCSFGEIPDVAIIELLYLIPSKLVHSRDEDGAGIHKSPFCLLGSQC